MFFLPATGASFVILDGALKGGEQLLVSLIEDGVVIRLHADLMEVQKSEISTEIEYLKEF